MNLAAQPHYYEHFVFNANIILQDKCHNFCINIKGSRENKSYRNQQKRHINNNILYFLDCYLNKILQVFSNFTSKETHQSKHFLILYNVATLLLRIKRREGKTIIQCVLWKRDSVITCYVIKIDIYKIYQIYWLGKNLWKLYQHHTIKLILISSRWSRLFWNKIINSVM